MEYISKDASDRRLKKLKRIIKRQVNIQKKAEIVMSKIPPGPQFIVGVKAMYLKPKIKIELPPLKIKTKVGKDYLVTSQTPVPDAFKKYDNLGVLQGVPKYLNKRIYNKSVELTKNKSNILSFSYNYKTPEPSDEFPKMLNLPGFK